ncbi:MAG: peptidase M22 [Clostridia bacterium]|nr:peptidase M22 [Clostridia bacterium]
MSCFLGIDTSNYTTSAALYDSENGIIQCKKLLPVKSGECGLRQSDAVFHHTQQLPQMIEELLSGFEGSIDAVGVSSRPRDVEGSYMPCFTVGLSAARCLSAAMKLPLYKFSHQSGHIAAAAYSAGNTDMLFKSFLAFHVSGGTTEAVLVRPDRERFFTTEIAARTLDLNAGQLIDRVGVMLGLDFPCGRELEKLASACEIRQKGRATLKGCDCCLSGTENLCRKAYEGGAAKEEVAALCLACVEKTLCSMRDALLEKYGKMPVLFAGGVMSNQLMRERLSQGCEAYFAEPEFSADNAAGIAYLCGMRHEFKD